jgi:hypothetical protein
MRQLLVGALVVAGCAGTPTDPSQPLERACSEATCFFERDIRDFEVVDQQTLVVYVGSQRCPFKIDLTGTFCDMTFAPELYFRSPGQVEREESRDVFGEPIGRPSSDIRICAGDLQLSVDGGTFTENRSDVLNVPTDRFGNARGQCQVLDIEPMTDDELVELYVAHGLTAPPPPMGSGEIEVGEQDEEAATLPAASPPSESTVNAVPRR